MQKDILLKIRDYIVKNSKVIFPVVVVVVVALTVVVALNMNRERTTGSNNASEEGTVSGNNIADAMTAEDVPLVLNEDSEIRALVTTYHNAMASGDLETLQSLYDTLTDNELARFAELSKYIDRYTEVEILTKQGPEEGSVIAFIYAKMCFVGHEEEIPGYEARYVCRDDQGNLYFKNKLSFTQEEQDYIKAISGHADVVELDTRVTVEYKELMSEHQELLAYQDELARQVDMAVGVTIAGVNQDDDQSGQEGDGDQEGDPAGPTTEPVADETPQYATATTTVNVRSSDSEQADKLGRVSTGTRLQVQEVRVNGWTKVVYEGKDGFIKSEYLQYAESASGQEVIGKVTATTNINIRAAGNETAEKLGMLAGGESLDLLAVEGDWCKVVFNGQIAYVKAEYVQQQ